MVWTGVPAVVVQVQVLGWLYSEKKKRSLVDLAGAVHVGNAVGTEALRPIVQAAGLGGVDQCQGRAAIRRSSFLVEVDGDVRDSGVPLV